MEVSDLSFEEIYEHYADGVFQYIYFLVGEERLAEDLTQETFVKAWWGLRAFKAESSYKTWLTTIARNTTYDHFKKKSALGFLPFLKQHEPVATYTPEIWLQQQYDQQELYAAIGRLKYEYREAIVLTKIEGFSAKEAATILGWNVKKVHNAVERGMKTLGQLLGGDNNA